MTFDYLYKTKKNYIIRIKLCESYYKQYGCNIFSAMPTILYEHNDNFDLQTSHVLPALIRKFNEAKDLYENGISQINVGSGEDLTISDLADLIAEVVGFNGEIIHDSSKPDGSPHKLMDVSKIKKLGWKVKTKLNDRIIQTYN